MLLIVIVEAFIFRLQQIELPLRYDEAFTYWFYASKSYTTVLTDYSFPNNHILHNVLVKFSTDVFGPSIPSIRLPALLAGILIVFVVFKIGERVHSTLSGLVMAQIFASLPIFINFSTNARGYSIQLLLVACLIWFASESTGVKRTFIKSTDQDDRFHQISRLGIIVPVLIITATIYTIPLSVLPISLFGLWYTRNFEVGNFLKRDFPRSIGIATGISFLLYLPTLNDRGWRYSPTIESNPFRFILDLLNYLLLGPNGLKVLFFGLTIVATVGVVRTSEARKYGWLTIMSWSLVPLSFLAGDKRPPFERTWIWLALITALFLGIGYASFVQIRGTYVRNSSHLIIALTTMFSGFASNYSPDDPPVMAAQSALEFLDELETYENPIILVSPYSQPPFEAHLLMAPHMSTMIRASWSPETACSFVFVSFTRGDSLSKVLSKIQYPQTEDSFTTVMTWDGAELFQDSSCF